MVKTLTITDALTMDPEAVSIANQWQEWNNLRRDKITDWEEVRKYLFAVDTTTTTNAQLPWKNKTTFPKLTQIADNLWANYMKSLFPKRQWLVWEGFDDTSEQKAKKDVIENYMMSVVDQSDFQKVVGQLLWDWIQYGNCFSTVEWVDERIQLEDKLQTGYVGPRIKRISPLDIVFNPIADTFANTPKIIRKFVTLGDVKEEIERLSGPGDHAEELWQYMKDIRNPNGTMFSAEFTSEDLFLKIDGFSDFRQYLGSDYAEVLTFHGDLFNRETGEFYRNHVITVVDRHKLIAKEPNPSYFGKAPIYHSAWRPKQDNLWGMGPLDNLIGMQYRIDHLENLKADVFDLNAFPPLKIKGLINDDFEWGPMERIHVGDDGDVNMVAPDFQILNANLEIHDLEQKMEDIAGAPRQAMGIRTPGEKTKYEVQQLENAAGRIFQARLEQFEDQQVQPSISAMLELSRRKMVVTELRNWDSSLKIATFQSITPQDIMGNGRIRPVAAKHFAEQAERVQNVTQFFTTVGQDQMVAAHFSSIKVAELFEDLLELKQFKLVTPFVRLSEQQQAQDLMNAGQEQSMNKLQTPSGVAPGDVNPQTVQDYLNQGPQNG